MTLKIAVLYGSYRTSRQGIKAAKFIVHQCQARGWETTLVDAKEYNLPMLDKMHVEYDEGCAPEGMQKVRDILQESDGFIHCFAEYNHSIPAGHKNLIDHFQSEFHFKPSGLACYTSGPFGGIRGAMHMRAICPEVGSPTTPTMFAISKVHESFDENGNATNDAYPRRIKKFLDEFEWFAQAMKAQRDKGTPY